VPGVLYRVIDEHLKTLLDAAAHHTDGHRVPKFVGQEFRDFLTRGVLALGFARLVPFSCRGRRSPWCTDRGLCVASYEAASRVKGSCVG
jgi:hypothetical protein